MPDPSHSRDSLVFRCDRPWPNPRLRGGAVVGHATPTSVRLWLRTGRPGDFSLLLYDCREALSSAAERRKLRAALGEAPLALEEAMNRAPAARRFDFTVEDYERDTTHVLDLQGLTSDTRYGYALFARDEERVIFGHNRLRRFRTPPTEDERRAFQFESVCTPLESHPLCYTATGPACGREDWPEVRVRTTRELDRAATATA